MIQVEQIGPVTKFKIANAFLGRPMYWTAAYLVDGLLVDTGCRFTAREFLRVLAREQVHTIVNTHHHEDHIGANAEVNAEHGARIFAHPLALRFLRHPPLLRLHPYRRVFWGWPLPSEGQDVPPEIATEHHRFQVLHTPGHSPDHLSLYEPDEGWIFTGDLFVGGKDRALRPDYNMTDALDSLRRIAGLRLSWLFPGSGKPRREPTQEVVDKIAYLEELRSRIRELHQSGRSGKQIARALLGRDGFIHYLTGGHFSTVNLVRACLREP